MDHAYVGLTLLLTPSASLEAAQFFDAFALGVEGKRRAHRRILSFGRSAILLTAWLAIEPAFYAIHQVHRMYRGRAHEKDCADG